ncbi:S-adenosyl-L-methionine-dependent methyltransferase [Stipitochalara longipes BDJ]|nr:S-adenosyl-L-methionine-dependent methyltransferase [Stipitochalara longipes BDJ]
MSSSKVNVVNLSEARFRERFQNAFDLDPTLTSEFYYQILLDVEFDEQKALWKVVDRVRKPQEFLVPDSVLRSEPAAIPTQFSTPINKKISNFQSMSSSGRLDPLGSGKKRPARHFPVEDSDDELLFPNHSEQSISDRPLISPFKTSPGKVPSFTNSTSFGDELVLTDDEDEDVRPMKKQRATRLPIRSTLSPSPSKLANKTKKQTTESLKSHRLKSAQSSQIITTLNSSNREILSFTPPSTKHSGKSSQTSATESFYNELSYTPELEDDEELDTDSDDSDSVRAITSPRGKCQQSNQTDSKDTKTETTFWLNRLARAYFAKSLAQAPTLSFGELEAQDKLALRDLTTHLEEIREKAWEHEVKDIAFIGPNSWDDVEGRTGYASVNIDGVIFRPGDCVILRSDPYAPRVKGKKADSQLDDEELDELPDPWYARIMYLFENKYGKAMAHFHWFEHGSKTILKEVSGPHELFLLTHCDDNPLSSIASKIEVDYLGDNITESGGAVEQDYLDSDRYFYRLHWDPRNEQFTSIPFHDTTDRNIQGPPVCSCCSVSSEKRLNRRPLRIIGSIPDNGSNRRFEGFHFGGIDYFIHDFIYIFSDPEKPYKMGQIKKITIADNNSLSRNSQADESNLEVKVEVFRRYDNFHKSYFEEFQDGQRHGCYVRHCRDIENLDCWKDQPDRFWVDLQVDEMIDPLSKIRPRDLVPLKKLEYSKNTEKELALQHKRRENFRKTGKKLRGLDIFAGAGGLSRGMHLSGAVKTVCAIERDRAACQIYKQNFPGVTVLNADANVLLDRAIRRENGEELEPLYDGDGELIPDLPRPGPPCQGFSISNRFQKADDIKNSLIVLYLSYLDFYRPNYFLLENVRGILVHKLGATQVDRHKTQGGIEKGTVKFILRALTSLGYQCQYTTLQAAEHNTPQSRRRVIFWAAQPGYPLPAFPQPSHVVNSRLSPLSWHRIRRSAPHAAVTVGAAITDLPAYDWINPHSVILQTQQERSDRERRLSTITQYEVERGSNFVGRNHQSYASKPLSEFQRKLRAGVPKDGLLNHVTMRWNEETIERVLHPTQHRVVSVREYARAMGMPDDFVFDLENQKTKDAIRQIGNSVPVPLAWALGNELFEVLLDIHEAEQQRSSSMKNKESAQCSIGAEYRQGSKDDPITLE